MAEPLHSQIWIGRALFGIMALVVIFAHLLPLDMEPTVWAAPDILLATTLAWVARRPDYAPFLLIVAIFFLTDLLFQRPPGLWVALVAILTEVLRARTHDIRNMPLMLEWGTVATGIVAITLANRALLTVAMTPQAPLGLTLIQMVMTILAYPLVVLVAHFAFGVTRTAPGQVNNLGKRL